VSIGISGRCQEREGICGGLSDGDEREIELGEIVAGKKEKRNSFLNVGRDEMSWASPSC
jgi:hypothetical protein